ncbi:alcohol dehydrogenase catalytic domain-containing protein [Streptomyces sp. NPDC088729]|uniref:alcohol dehydrogenase catalytic domain-containing protein n=1 Tax=Streptomyces sp. NPDC088729 TaxID=3365876 RepID=UPI0038153A57
MRAIAISTYLAEPGLVELPKPEPGAGEVRIKVEYAALNPHDRPAARNSADGSPYVFPLVVGVDFAGRVDMIGKGGNRFRVGDPVVGMIVPPRAGQGAFCEYVSVSQHSPLALVPRDFPLRLAAALPSAGTAAVRILRTLGLPAGASLLVVGAAGGVGGFLTQLAAAHGLRVLAAVRGDETRRMESYGATATLDTTTGALEAGVRRVFPDGVDALVDLASASRAAFAETCALVRNGGTALSTRGAAPPDGSAAPATALHSRGPHITITGPHVTEPHVTEPHTARSIVATPSVAAPFAAADPFVPGLHVSDLHVSDLHVSDLHVTASHGSASRNSAPRPAPDRTGTPSATRSADAPPRIVHAGFRLDPTSALLDLLVAEAVAGTLRVPVERELPLEKAPQALARNRRRGARGKTVLAL